MVQAQGPDGYDTYYVAKSCTGVPTPCFTIVQDAVDAADDPDDVVKIASGTYTDVNDSGILVYINKTITIRGGYTVTNWTTPHPITQPTTLDAQRQGPVLYAIGPGISLTIEGLHITGGKTGGFGGGLSLGLCDVTLIGNTIYGNLADDIGGGLYLGRGNTTLIDNVIISNTSLQEGGGLYMNDSDATLSGNIIANNITDLGWGGGGLYLDDSNVTLDDNIIISNIAGYNQHSGYGGGVYLSGGNAIFNSNIITGNIAAQRGGGLYMGGTGNTTLTNNIIADNQASLVGSGLYVGGSPLRLLHNTIAHNTGGDGSGIYARSNSTIFLTNTILVSHTVGITVTDGSVVTLDATLWGTGTWANTADWAGAGNITTGTVNVWGDPSFVNPDAGNYHITTGSAAVDAGVNAGVTTDVEGKPRPIGSGYDIGADELGALLAVTKRASPNPVQTGEQLIYTIRVTNTGNVTLTATITDFLPAHITPGETPSGTLILPSGTITWTPIIIPLDDVWMETVVVTVEADYDGPLVNLVQVTTEEGALDNYTEVSHVGAYHIYLPLVLRQYP